MKCSAGYEFLWRYGYPTRPEHPPLKDGWNACGGSVTSVSNPHIHPMGVLADEDLLYLAEVTGDSYYRERALDSAARMMQTLELYPDKAGYGRYGILSERWSPSDGLVTERYDSGEPYGSWFSYNLWAAVNVFEAVLHHLGSLYSRPETLTEDTARGCFSYTGQKIRKRYPGSYTDADTVFKNRITAGKKGNGKTGRCKGGGFRNRRGGRVCL